MTKKLAAMIAHAQCPKGGAHEWELSWPEHGPDEEPRYIQTCKNCRLIEDLDPYLGLGKVSHARFNRAYAKRSIDKPVATDLE